MANGFRCAFCGEHEEDHNPHLSEKERHMRGIHHSSNCLGYIKGHKEIAFDQQQLKDAQARLAASQHKMTLAH